MRVHRHARACLQLHIEGHADLCGCAIVACIHMHIHTHIHTCMRMRTHLRARSSMLEVMLTCVATSSGAKMGSTKKKLPMSTTLAALRTLCEKLCKVGAGGGAKTARAWWREMSSGCAWPVTSGAVTRVCGSALKLCAWPVRARLSEDVCRCTSYVSHRSTAAKQRPASCPWP